ncbi:hypothetical protein IB236_01240 [Acidovorax sp. ACV02]|uniref:hypothetical protein n=1 Tax=Acidovorax sp. ACV02 TaxID=2769310 RepID=UPI001780E0B8|nr:hypothetical protein [Acidovorax sp. ACV02]MBD9403931.1 hypothetical protein [Acidovorax sp. ACV02]
MVNDLFLLVLAGLFSAALIPAALGIGLVFALVRKPVSRFVGILLVLGVWTFFANKWVTSGESQRHQEDRKYTEEFRPHAAHFEMVCEQAGTKVFETAKDVKSIALQAPRGDFTTYDLWDRNFKGDVYGGFDVQSSQSAEWDLVRTFLTKKEWEQQWHVPTKEDFLRYPQIEIQGHNEGEPGFFRYLDSSVGSHQTFSKGFHHKSESRYFVKWEDISTPQDREHWVAGSKWTITDLETGTLMAERIAYAIDLYQGSTKSDSYGNSGLPWIRAGHIQQRRPPQDNACPSKTPLYNLDFVRSVLKPIDQAMKVIPRPVR